MTRMTHSTVHMHPPLLRQPVEVCWSAVAAGNDPRLMLQSSGPREVSLRMRLLPQTNDQVIVTAAIVEHDHAGPLIDDVQAELAIVEDGRLLHATITDSAGAELLTLSLRFPEAGHQPEVLYARSPLLGKAGFTGGRCDPPTIRPINA